MQSYEYAVVPAPRKGAKTKGARTPDERFAHALTQAINARAADGWEYLRTDTMPSEERTGLTGRATVYQTMLIFRRPGRVAEASLRPIDPPGLVVGNGSGEAPLPTEDTSARPAPEA